MATVVEVPHEVGLSGLTPIQTEHLLIKAECEAKREIERLQAELQILEEQLGSLRSRTRGGLSVVARPASPSPVRARRFASRAAKPGLHTAVLQKAEEEWEGEEGGAAWLGTLRKPSMVQELPLLGQSMTFRAYKQGPHRVLFEGKGEAKGAGWLEDLKELPEVRELLAPVVREQLKGVADHSREPKLGETLRIRYRGNGTVESAYMRSDLGGGPVKDIEDLVVEVGYDEGYLYGGEVTVAGVAQMFKKGAVRVWRKGTFTNDGTNEKLVSTTKANC